MKKTYECMLLLDNREVRKGWPPLKDAVTGTFRKHGAEVVSARRWDERRLAYAIRGQRRGTYLLVYYAADTNANVGIRRDLELNEFVLRHLITVCEQVPGEAYQPEVEFDVNAIPLEDTPPVVETMAPDAMQVESGQQSAEELAALEGGVE